MQQCNSRRVVHGDVAFSPLPARGRLSRKLTMPRRSGLWLLKSSRLPREIRRPRSYSLIQDSPAVVRDSSHLVGGKEGTHFLGRLVVAWEHLQVYERVLLCHDRR